MDNLHPASKEDVIVSMEESPQTVTLKLKLNAMGQISINVESLQCAKTVHVFAMIQLWCTPSVTKWSVKETQLAKKYQNHHGQHASVASANARKTEEFSQAARLNNASQILIVDNQVVALPESASASLVERIQNVQAACVTLIIIARMD